MRYVNYRDKKKVATALRPVYTATNAEIALAEFDAFEAERGKRYPACVQAWRTAWENATPFLAIPAPHIRTARFQRRPLTTLDEALTWTHTTSCR